MVVEVRDPAGDQLMLGPITVDQLVQGQGNGALGAWRAAGEA